MSRVFIGFQVDAPWPAKLPNGGHIHPGERHMTLAFLGDVDLDSLLSHLPEFPLPPLTMGFVGHFSETLFLPPKHPSVVAWHADLEEKHREISEYQLQVSDWLKLRGFPPAGEHRVWLPHVSICRTPFDKHEWEQVFEKYPFTCSKIHLYESVGNLRYESRWIYSLFPPFEQIKNSEGLVYTIRGKSLDEVYKHTQAALTFLDTHFLSAFDERAQPKNIEQMERSFNDSLRRVNAKWGSSVKSLRSIEGDKENQGYLEWKIEVQ